MMVVLVAVWHRTKALLAASWIFFWLGVADFFITLGGVSEIHLRSDSFPSSFVLHHTIPGPWALPLHLGNWDWETSGVTLCLTHIDHKTPYH